MNDYIKDLKQMKFSKDSKEKRNVEQQDCSTFEGSVSEKAQQPKAVINDNLNRLANKLKIGRSKNRDSFLARSRTGTAQIRANPESYPHDHALSKLSPKHIASQFTYMNQEEDPDLESVVERRKVRSATRLNQEDSQARKLQIDLRFCTACNIEQPLRSKHCRACGRCVTTYDHHCPWIGNCVGERNKSKFYVYLWLQKSMLIFAIVSCVELLKLDPLSVFQKVVSILMICLAGIFLLFVTNLLVFHSFLAVSNTTTWECLSWNKISYLKNWPRKLGSPFS